MHRGGTVRWGTLEGSGGQFGGVPELGWQFASVAQATATQSTGLSTTFSDQANNEIQCEVALGTNNAGVVESAGYMLIPIMDTRGRGISGAGTWYAEIEVIPVTAPANATFLYLTAGVTTKTTTAALNLTPNYLTAGVNYQPATNPRGYYLVKTNGGGLTALTIGGASAIGTSGGRVHHGMPILRKSTADVSALSGIIYSAADAILTGAACNIAGALDSSAGNLRLIIAAGTVGGSAAANTKIGCKVRYRVTKLNGDA